LLKLRVLESLMTGYYELYYSYRWIPDIACLNGDDLLKFYLIEIYQGILSLSLPLKFLLLSQGLDINSKIYQIYDDKFKFIYQTL